MLHRKRQCVHDGMAVIEGLAPRAACCSRNRECVWKAELLHGRRLLFRFYGILSYLLVYFLREMLSRLYNVIQKERM